MSLEFGQVIEGKYRITRLLGEGGMGAVYEGENIRIRRKVAIKVLHAAFTENQEVVQRFEREAQAAGRIGNDHILEVLDLGQLPDGDLFLVMEYLDGEALSGRCHRLGRLKPEHMVPLMLQALEGLAAAHNAGIIHRDLKPDNIFILKEKAGVTDFVKIIDFGISKFQPMSGDGMKMTKTGAVMGTPYYMSPEQATGSREADARSDIYALGVIMYECVSGTVPFDAPSFNQLLFKIALSTPPPLEQVAPEIDRGFCSIVSKAMARDVDARFSSCREFADALRAWSQDRRGVSLPPPVTAEAMRADAVGRGAPGGPPAIAAAAPVVSTPARVSEHPSLAPAGLPTRNNAVVIGLALAAVLVLGGGWLAYASLSGDDTVEAPSAAPSAAVAPAPEAPPKVDVVKTEVTPAPAVAPPKEPEPRVAPDTATTPPATPPKAETAKPSVTTRAPAAPRPTAQRLPPAPVTKPVAPPPSKPKAPAGDVDYGY